MPYIIEKRTGARPWKILKDGKIIGSSVTKAKAEASVKARYAAH